MSDFENLLALAELLGDDRKVKSRLAELAAAEKSLGDVRAEKRRLVQKADKLALLEDRLNHLEEKLNQGALDLADKWGELEADKAAWRAQQADASAEATAALTKARALREEAQAKLVEGKAALATAGEMQQRAQAFREGVTELQERMA